MADKTKSPEPQLPAENGKKAAKVKKQKQVKPKAEADAVRLPVLVELTITLCAIFLVIVFFTMIGVSVVAGAKLLDLVVRTSISILIIGFLLILIARQVSMGMISASLAVEEEAQQKQSEEKNDLETQSPSEVK